MQSVEGMKVICHELTQAADPESTILEELIKEADRLVSCLAVMVNIILFSLLVCVLFSTANSFCWNGYFRSPKPSILAYLGLPQDPANMS